MKKTYGYIKFILFILFVLSFSSLCFGMNHTSQFTFSLLGGGYLFEGNESYGGGPHGGIGLGYVLSNKLSTELHAGFGYFEKNMLNKTKYEFSIDDIDTFIFDAELKYHLTPFQLGKFSIAPYLLLGAGDIMFDQKEENQENNEKIHYPMLNYGAGFHMFLTDSLAFRADARHLLTYDDHDIKPTDDISYRINNNFYYTIGLTLFWGKPSQGISKAEQYDAQGKIYGKKPTGVIVDIHGKTWDSDDDGVYEHVDKCPGTPKGIPVDNKGCPPDLDQDGVFDYKDKCPNTPLGALVNIEGCFRDTDGDSIPDIEDQCPSTPPGTVVNEAGCPMDSDGDGIPDVEDQCKETLAGVKVDDKGCPIIIVPKKPITISLNIKFEPNKADIKPIYYEQIKQVAEFLDNHPESNATIEAHTDSQGSKSYNLKLSQKRADAVKKALIEYFQIDAHRITAIGYGENRPIADNATEEGRQLNRRAVAVISANE